MIDMKKNKILIMLGFFIFSLSSIAGDDEKLEIILPSGVKLAIPAPFARNTSTEKKVPHVDHPRTIEEARLAEKCLKNAASVKNQLEIFDYKLDRLPSGLLKKAFDDLWIAAYYKEYIAYCMLEGLLRHSFIKVRFTEFYPDAADFTEKTFKRERRSISAVKSNHVLIAEAAAALSLETGEPHYKSTLSIMEDDKPAYVSCHIIKKVEAKSSISDSDVRVEFNKVGGTEGWEDDPESFFGHAVERLRRPAAACAPETSTCIEAQ